MPEPIEVAAYQLGIRSSQCCQLHDHCVAEIIEDWDKASGDNLVLLRYALDRLDHAFSQLASLLELDSPSAAVGKALIEDCFELWEEWQELTRAELCEHGLYESSDSSPFHDRLARLADLVCRFLRSYGTDGERAVNWYELGVELCRVAGRLSEAYDLGAVARWGSRLPQPLPQLLSEWEGDFHEELKFLLQAVNVSVDQLCPPISADQAGRLLPYEPELYGMWFRIEAGLIELTQVLPAVVAAGVGSDAPTVEQDAESAMDPSARLPGPANTSLPDSSRGVKWQQAYLGMQFDCAERRVRRQDHGPIRLSKVLWQLLQMFDATRAKYASRERLAAAWTEFGRPQPTPGTITDAVAELAKKLAPLGIGVENVREVGWRLVESDGVAEG